MLLDLLSSLDRDDWTRPTECPAYSVQGVATHVLGDDLSLLSRQRDSATNGVMLMAEEHPGRDLRTLLDMFNDRWVMAGRFLSPGVLIDLLHWSGEQTATFYESVDPTHPCEPVFVFGSQGEPPPTGRRSPASSSNGGCTTPRSAGPWRCPPSPTTRSCAPAWRRSDPSDQPVFCRPLAMPLTVSSRARRKVCSGSRPSPADTSRERASNSICRTWSGSR
jgi:hypothetical protein